MYPTTSLEPGSSGAEVKKLQDFLVSKGFMTQAQVNTGYGTYGPQTTAAVTSWQQANGVNAGSNYGYWGPLSITAASKGTSTPAPTQTTTVTPPPMFAPTNFLQQPVGQTNSQTSTPQLPTQTTTPSVQPPVTATPVSQPAPQVTPVVSSPGYHFVIGRYGSAEVWTDETFNRLVPQGLGTEVSYAEWNANPQKSVNTANPEIVAFVANKGVAPTTANSTPAFPTQNTSTLIGSVPATVPPAPTSSPVGSTPTPTPTAPVSTYTGPSVTDYLASTNRDTSFSYRTALATAYGIPNYTGTAEQNTQLLTKLKADVMPSTTATPPSSLSPTNFLQQPVGTTNANSTPQFPAGVNPSIPPVVTPTPPPVIPPTQTSVNPLAPTNILNTPIDQVGQSQTTPMLPTGSSNVPVSNQNTSNPTVNTPVAPIPQPVNPAVPNSTPIPPNSTPVTNPDGSSNIAPAAPNSTPVTNPDGSSNIAPAPAPTVPVIPAPVTPAPTPVAPPAPRVLEATTQNAGSSYQGVSVVDYLNSLGQDSSYAARAALANSMGIANYTGTATQNEQLLANLRSKNPAPAATNPDVLSANGITPPTSTPQALPPPPIVPQNPNEVGKSETQIVIDRYKEIYTSLGLGDVKAQYEKYIKEQTDMANERDDKIADVGMNPWLSEGLRSKTIANITDKYASKLDNLTNQAKLMDSIYQQGQLEVNKIAGDVQDNRMKAIDIAMQQQEAIDKIKAANKLALEKAASDKLDAETRLKIANISSATSLAKGSGSGSGSGLTASERKAQALGSYESTFANGGNLNGKSIKYSNGFLTGDAFKAAISDAASQGIGRSEFVKQYANYLDPLYIEEYGLSPQELKLVVTVDSQL